MGRNHSHNTPPSSLEEGCSCVIYNCNVIIRGGRCVIFNCYGIIRGGRGVIFKLMVLLSTRVGTWHRQVPKSKYLYLV